MEKRSEQVHQETRGGVSAETSMELGVQELWGRKDVLTFSFRRHGEWKSDHERVPPGTLTPEGIESTKEKARQWVEHAPNPKEANISMYESPSHMPSGVKRGGERKTIFPIRTSQTGSIYEKKIFGDLDSTKEADSHIGGRESLRRERVSELGDFMESVNAEGVSHIGSFFKAKGKAYGDDSERFWHDYVNRTLDPEVEQALRACNASDSLQLAENIGNFLQKFNEDKKEFATEDTDKAVGIGITHGETMESFLHFLSKFLAEKGGEIDADTQQVLTGRISYDDGVDIHIMPDGEATVVRVFNGTTYVVHFNIGEYQKYVSTLKGISEE